MKYGPAIDQLGHDLMQIIHAFAQSDKDMKFFMEKWDIKDGIWHLNCALVEEWIFSYVLPQAEGEQVRLVVLIYLQMGWNESPPYFCAASETARDVAQKYRVVPAPDGTIYLVDINETHYWGSF